MREPAEMIAQLVLCDPPQPTAKRVGRPFLAESADVGDNGLEDLLKDISDILILQSSPPAPVKDERSVEGDQSIPGFRLVRLHARQQAPRRRR